MGAPLTAAHSSTAPAKRIAVQVGSANDRRWLRFPRSRLLPYRISITHHMADDVASVLTIDPQGMNECLCLHRPTARVLCPGAIVTPSIQIDRLSNLKLFYPHRLSCVARAFVSLQLLKIMPILRGLHAQRLAI